MAVASIGCHHSI